ncbi:MAG: hypothetical protein ACI9DC_000367 [Gammaproteobacteria bacterium]|jgi:hypothetical protein
MIVGSTRPIRPEYMNNDGSTGMLEASKARGLRIRTIPDCSQHRRPASNQLPRRFLCNEATTVNNASNLNLRSAETSNESHRIYGRIRDEWVMRVPLTLTVRLTRGT